MDLEPHLKWTVIGDLLNNPVPGYKRFRAPELKQELLRDDRCAACTCRVLSALVGIALKLAPARFMSNSVLFWSYKTVRAAFDRSCIT